MAARTKINGLNGAHTAGIFSDMTVDGPDIGTLIVIVDRAKNLPNLKSIGKQNPYCAARLGKEAKKTETDKRGGQTPKWDQELRFTVRDSPDYFQMKVSVFNDDKRTDLIGETWVDLKEIILPGGGQNDLWHNLSCKGKYAGEIRIEITYYDIRPKQERPGESVRQSSNSKPESIKGRESLGGPRAAKATPKRRPLPSDPTSTNASPVGTPEYFPVTPRGHQTPQAYIQTQSPLQAVEYNTPSPHAFPQTPQTYGQSSAGTRNYGPPQGAIAVTPAPRPVQSNRYEIYDPAGDDEYIPGNILGRHDEPITHERDEPQTSIHAQQAAYGPSFDPYAAPPSPSGPPPPPPAHRSNHGSPAVTHQNSYNTNYSTPSQSIPRPSADRPEAYRHSMPAYNSNDAYQAYSPPKAYHHQEDYSQSVELHQSGRHRQSYDDKFHPQYESMQPSVEDAPPSPAPEFTPADHHNSPLASQSDDRRYEHMPSPLPLNLGGRGSRNSGHHNPSSNQSQPYYTEHSSAASPVSYRDYSQINSQNSSRTSFSQQSRQSQQNRQSEEYSANLPNGYLPPVPPSLVAGMDPVVAQEVSDRIYDDKRASYNQNPAVQARGRYQEQPQQPPLYQDYQHTRSYSDAQPVFVPAAATYDDRQSRITTGTYTPVIKPRAISPDPRVPTRKSVSPAPPTPTEEPRRLSGIPYGPDAYDALNPNVTPVRAGDSNYHIPNGQDVDLEAKIILPDGREVDPSDHLPEHSWAPEPEVKAAKVKAEPPTSRARPSPMGAQTMPTSGRRPLRVAAGRPHSMSTAAVPTYMSGAIPEPSTPALAAGRNRLQKKANRNSTQPAPQSSPLAPISPYQDNSYASRTLPRAHTLDFTGENYGHASYDGWNENPGSRGTAGPPIPAKLPMNDYGPPQLPPAESAWALLEEMKTIDLGSGRARRKGHSHAAA